MSDGISNSGSKPSRELPNAKTIGLPVPAFYRWVVSEFQTKIRYADNTLYFVYTS